MSKELGSQPLGDFYIGKRYKRRRPWRGFKDTAYDYWKWLGYWKVLISFTLKPNNVKGFFRYRWMKNYLAMPDFMDRHTEGMRGTQLRLAHDALGLIVVDICAMLETIFRADPAIGNDKELNSKIVLFDENMMSTLMAGFPNLTWLSAEVPSVYTPAMMNQKGVSHYVDATHVYGVPSDVCPMPAAELGLAISGDFPLIGKCAVQCNTTCDGSLMGNGLESEYWSIPTFQLAVPIRHRQESVQEYAAEEVVNAIHFIEEQTGEKFDWDAFFTAMKRFNAENQQFHEWLQISATDYPQMMGTTLALYRYGVYQAAGGRNQAFLDMDNSITARCIAAFQKKEMAAREYRHRCLTWGVQAAYYTAFPVWLMNCWGIVPICDMLTLMTVKDVDTEDHHQAMLDLAWLYENMIMRNRSNGGYETGVAALWEYCEMLHIDMVIMYAHMGCKSMSGYHGIFEEEARARGIHFIWVDHNLMVPEDGPRREMRASVNRYMRSVLQEEPLDPSLENFDDSLAW